jgi:hypothetical protein
MGGVVDPDALQDVQQFAELGADRDPESGIGRRLVSQEDVEVRPARGDDAADDVGVGLASDENPGFALIWSGPPSGPFRLY